MVKKAVLLNYTDETESMLNEWYNEIKALLPDNQTVIATNILDKILNVLKLYANTSSYEYFEEYLSMDIASEEKEKIEKLIERIKNVRTEK